MKSELKNLLDDYLNTYIIEEEVNEAKLNLFEERCLSAPKRNFFKVGEAEEEETFVCEAREDAGIDTFINAYKNKYNDFQTMLFDYIDKRGAKDSEIYNKANIDRKLFSKIRGANYHPSKNTVIKLALALELDEDEMDKLLESASYSLPKNNEYDLIIRFCFLHNIYDLNDVNELLDNYNCDVLD